MDRLSMNCGNARAAPSLAPGRRMTSSQSQHDLGMERAQSTICEANWQTSPSLSIMQTLNNLFPQSPPTRPECRQRAKRDKADGAHDTQLPHEINSKRHRLGEKTGLVKDPGLIDC